jgi:protein arginine N-methyltransferase 5
VHPSHAKDIHVPTATSLFPSASPSPSSPSSSSQQKIIALGNQSRQVSFVMDQATTLHGVAGYFHCTLYKDIVFSTVPEQIGTLSPGMFSWFPMYFPMTHPVSVRAGDAVDVNMWRCVDGDRMWYEWSIRARAAASSGSPPPPTTPAATVGPLAAVQNTLGRAFHVQL